MQQSKLSKIFTRQMLSAMSALQTFNVQMKEKNIATAVTDVMNLRWYGTSPYYCDVFPILTTNL